MKIEGHLDRLRAGVVDGWAWNPAAPNNYVCIEVWNSDGALLAIGVANQYREDLFQAGKGNGAHGFSIRLPEQGLKTKTLTVRVLGEDTELVGSPYFVEIDSKDSENFTLLDFDAFSRLEVLHSLDKSYASAFIEISQRLEKRKQKLEAELLDLNKSHPSIINTLFNPSSRLPASSKRDIIIFPPIDWDYRYQRPQQISCELASLGHRVFYVAPTFIAENSEVGTCIYDSPAPGVFLIKLRCDFPHPEINKKAFSEAQILDLSEKLRHFIANQKIRSPALIFQNPVWSDLDTDYPGKYIIYDCLDLISGFEATSREMLDTEKKLIDAADIITASSIQLVEHIKNHNSRKNVLLVRNATSSAYFFAPPPRPSPEDPVIGYLGAIEEWFDVDLVAEIAKLKPNWTIALAGHPLARVRETLSLQPNIRFLGEIEASRAAEVVGTFDATIIPFKPDGMTPFVNPVKVYEYLAAGRGVVACRMPELDQFGQFVSQAENAVDFCKNLQTILETNDDFTINSRKTCVMNETWNTRAQQISNVVNFSLSIKNSTDNKEHI